MPLTVPAWHLDCARNSAGAAAAGHSEARRQRDSPPLDPPKIGRRSWPAPNSEQGRLGREAMTALIEAKELRKSFGDLKAVDGISLTVPRGEVLGFLGPNGAGKSTTMKMLTGFLEPDSGTRAHRRLRRAGATQARQGEARLSARGRAALRRNDAAQAARVHRRPARLRAPRGRRGAPASPSSAPGWSRCSTAPSRPCPRASSAASAWRRPSCTTPRC